MMINKKKIFIIIIIIQQSTNSADQINTLQQLRLYNINQVMLKNPYKLLLYLYIHITTFIHITKSIQLCNPYTAAFPCTACQPYAYLSGGFCTCVQGYYMATDLSYQYCDLCHSSCKSCYGPLSTNCISCPSSFSFNNVTASCDTPNSVNQSLFTQVYSIQGFNKLTDWTITGFSTDTIQCGLRTILGGTKSSSTNSISVSLSNLPNHFRIRVRAQFIIFDTPSNIIKKATVTIGSSTNSTIFNSTGYPHESCLSRTYITVATDMTVLHSGASGTLTFDTSVDYNWGIRDIIITVWKCASNCSTCTGYLATQCSTCTEAPKRTANQIIAGTCQCTGLYYQQPYAGTCVDPCPSVPTKYYGDNTTKNCVTECPTGFAIDDFYRCWTDCPTTSPKNSKLLYRDYTNKKCVENCPATQPYGDPVNRRCYSQCPSPRFGSNTTDMICVTTCPHTNLDGGIYKTYSSGRYCVPYCPSTTFADPGSASCINPCTNSSYPLMDNSTGQNLCVASCPPPNRFASSGTCVQICPAGQYGDITTWQCTTMCTSPNWGLQSYNRKCVPVCPSNTWARPSTRTCVNTTLQCGTKYADNYSRTCVVATACSFGTYGDPTTYSCVAYCPSGRYGHPTTKVCETGCASPYFADPGVNLCVSSCMTAGLYADVYSSRTCVSACNNLTGSTPWADDSNRTCMADCNQTVSKYLADNTTWKCVYDCPLTHVADFTTTAPKCVITCPTGWFADATGGTFKICVQKCSTNPPQFGDDVNGTNLCVDICAPGTFGDQTGNRLCRKTCPSPYFAQNNDIRRCVKVCNQSSYGYQLTCTVHVTNCPWGYNRVCYQDPHSCPSNYFGDPSTQLCVNPCPASQLTFGDPQTKLCVRACPNNPNYTAGSYVPQTYYADISNRQCVLRCSSTYSPPLFGNNSTRTCQSKCIDFESYAQVQSTYRICVDRCWVSPTFYYANNLTKTCGTDMNCPSNYYGQNNTQICVQKCPNTSWGFRNVTRRLCMDICPVNYVGDDSTQKRICILLCPVVPDRFADLTLRICVDMCNSSLYGQPLLRTCTTLCPPNYYSYQPTRRCIKQCPYGYFGDDRDTVRKCQPSSNLCTGRFGDPYLWKCVGICTGPSPVNTFGSGSDCVSFCPNGTYADSYSASRLCVGLCPPGVVNSTAGPDLYGDPTTHTCEGKCITPQTWADFQTRLCQNVCSSSPIPTYSQNFNMRCVISLNCPTSPALTFGDNTTRSCLSFCSNNQWGDPTSRNCVTQCPNISTTNSSRFYGDNSTGQRLCVQICPTTPRLFGQNVTNLCVAQCPPLTFGDQSLTENRTCVYQCPVFGLVLWYAQNDSRICVTVCKNGTWGLNSTRQCVQDPFQCGSLWADSSTHLCVTTCPSIANLFGDSGTRTCVPVCPNGTFADDLSRTCVTQCPQNNGVHDTFGNNDTHICQQTCTQANAYADPQTNNRYCVLNCSQHLLQSFADPSTKTCVPRCPTFPSLFGQIQNYRCVSSCVSPYFADTHQRRCVLHCDNATQFKLRNPRLCVTTCPSSDDLFGDTTGYCQTSCTSGYRYAVLRICVPDCTTYFLFDYNGTCVQYCPYTYYADTDGHCVNPCPLATLFGQNTTTTCRTTCLTGYAHNNLCKAICPDNLWGYNGVCRTSCPNGTASNVSNLCIGLCDVNTFNQNGLCVANCSTDYADPNTRLCTTTCTLNRYKQPVSHTCVEVCPAGSFRDPAFICKTNCAPLRADNLSNTCTSRCSNGTWGYNYVCISQCPPLYYGYQSNRDCFNISSIPDTNLFADNITQAWVATCSQNPLKFGDTQSHQCVTACTLSTQYADPQSRKCQATCTNNSYYRDPTTKTCVLICPQGYYANPQNGKCEQDCTLGRYNYNETHFCVVSCPKPYYGLTNTSNKICVEQCPAGKFAEDDLCKGGCTLPLVADSVTHRCVNNCIDSYASTDDIACVDVAGCVAQGKVADNSTNKCVPTCPTDPDYYNQNGICVPYCNGTFSDPTAGVRICTSMCTEGLYGDPVSGRCLSSCLPGYYAFNDTNLCVLTCPNGFADNQTGICVRDCGAPTFADSLNNRCMRICSRGQFGEGRVCVPSCNESLYGNPLTMQCQTSCPAFDYIFAQNTTNLCVKNCSFVAGSYADRGNNYCMDNCSRANQYALDIYGICTSLCPAGQFMQNSTKKCQSGCTTGYAQPTSRFCVQRCFGSNPQSFAHVTNQKCVLKCLTATENLYADNFTNYCVVYNNCTRSPKTFSDPISGHCVLFCPEGLYAENTTFTCTDYCILGFADNLTRMCMDICPANQSTFGDPNTHRCVKVCPDNWYANNDTQQCVQYNNCPANTWSDILSKYCVPRCPSQPQYFGYDTTTSCVKRCPSTPQLYGDTVTQKCIWPCTNSNLQKRFADSISQKCVFVCPISLGLYGDPTTGKCTSSCDPINPYKDNSTQRCVALCPSNPDYYAYITNHTCVRVCPTGLYASDANLRVCTNTCQPNLTFADQTTNRCVAQCPIPYFADDSTYKCVRRCPQNPDYFADPHTRTCKPSCPIGPNDTNGNPQWISWEETLNRTCVTRCPDGYFAQNSSGRCTNRCPVNQYADLIIQVCVAQCTVRPGFYKQTASMTCVTQCPSSPVKAHKYAVTHTCLNMTGSVSGCPGLYFANQVNSECTTFCPHRYYADTHSKFCRLNCTNGQFGDPVDRKCKSGCTTNPSWYAYTVDMICVQYCPSPYFSENKTWTCTGNCPNLTDGTVLYSYDITRQCVINCPSPYYSYVINQTCLLGCPSSWYANDETRTCDQACTGTYNADSSTNRCVQNCPTTPNLYSLNNRCIPNCPNGTYKDNSTRSCVVDCPYLPLTYANDYGNQCVEDCPSTPNYFADNETRKCVSNCSQGFFADTSTRRCVLACPDGTDTYADPLSWVCQPACPAPNYISTLTNQCVNLCPNIPVKTYAQDIGRFCTTRCMSGFGNNDTRKCQANCLSMTDAYADITTNMCVTTCPLGFFAYNLTAECRSDCPGLFADSTTRKCVANCPGTQRLYADSTTSTCVSICPSGWYGQTQTWTCQNSCASLSAGYILQVSRQCVSQCPSPYFAYVSQRLCVQNCGTGLYGNQVNRECETCPNVCITCLSLTNCLSCTSSLYLQFGACVSSCTVNSQIANYANNNTMACGAASRCPSGTFGNNGTQACQISCPPQMYGNQTSRTCQNCPHTCTACSTSTNCSACITGAQLSLQDNVCYAHCSVSLQYNYGGVCYASCPAGTYLDYTNVYCQACNAICLTCFGSSMNCTSCDNTFQYNNSCVTKCPAGYYGTNSLCSLCNDQIPSCSTPLTFNTTTTVQNYKQVVIIKFNQNATVNDKPQNFIKVNLQMTRRILSSISDIVNNGIGFTAVVLPDGTIKLYLDPGVSLDNVKYSIVITNPNSITTASGGTLQNLQQFIQLTNADVYPQEYTTKSPLIVAGKILAIIMLACVFFMLIIGVTPLYLAVQAVQIMSLFAYTKDLAPNLFYFLKQLRLSRFVFIPSIFSSVYVQPSGHVDSIPQKLLDAQGQLSFAVNASSFIYFALFFLLISIFVFVMISKLITNRPLKLVFQRVWETRIKYGIINDFIWIFALNIFMQWFLQFRYTNNSGDLALSIVFGLITLALTIGILINAIIKYKKNQQQQLSTNYRLLFEGTKQQWYHKFYIFIYNIRKILFPLILILTIQNTRAMAASMLTLFSLVGLAALIIRPYKQHINNIAILVNEGFLGFFCGGILYYLGMIDKQQPSGAKITNGLILTIVIIIHLSLMISWSAYRSYRYIKQLYEQFQKTQFYKLYMDQQYDQILEKQISQLNQDEKGQVQSVQITNISKNQNKNIGQQGQQDQIIKLKIKRRIRKQKFNKNIINKQKQKDMNKIQQHKNNMKVGQYVKIQQNNQKYYKLKSNSRVQMQDQYEKIIFDNKLQIDNDNREEQRKQNQWVKLQKLNHQVQQQQQHAEQNKLDIEQELQQNKQIQVDVNLLDNINETESKQYHKKIGQFQDMVNQDNDDRIQEQRNRKKIEMDKKMRQTYKSSFADFDQANYFSHQPKNNKEQKSQNQEKNQQNKHSPRLDEQIFSQAQLNSQIKINNNQNQNQEKNNDIENEDDLLAQPKFNQNNNQQQVYSEQFQNPDQQKYQKQQQAELNNQPIIENKQILEQSHPKNQKIKQQEYKVFNFDELQLSEQNNNQHEEQQQNMKQEHNQPAKSNPKWSIQVEDLIQDKNQDDEQQKKRKEKSKKMHMMLFDEDQDQGIQQ